MRRPKPEAGNGKPEDEQEEEDEWEPLMREPPPEPMGWRLSWREVNGALGDLGTFIPLTTALAASGQVNVTNAVFFAGLFNVLTAYYFDVPVSVQPMHTITAVAVTQELSGEEICGAGLVIGALVLTLGASGLITTVSDLVPRSVVRGIQLGLGVGLISQAVSDYCVPLDSDGARVWVGIDSVLTAVLAGVFTFVCEQRYAHVPTALALFGLGLVLALWGHPSLLSEFSVGCSFAAPLVPSWAAVAKGGVEAALPQLPLTTLNSVVALHALAADLFPHNKTMSERRIASSIGGVNLVLVWFGAIPSCHGAGGLAAQYAFGARTPASMALLGGLKMTTALLFGSWLLLLLQQFPSSVLGVLLVVSGIHLSKACFDQHSYRDRVVVLVTTGATLAQNTGVGFVLGCGVWLLLRSSSDGDGDGVGADQGAGAGAGSGDGSGRGQALVEGCC